MRRSASRFERRRWLTLTAFNLAAIAVLLALPEATAHFLLEFPAPLRGRTLEVFRTYYMLRDRKIIQFLPECAVYDPELTYTLKPGGECRVVNREHTIDYSINSKGLRDDESSLHGPEIIVLGDSHAMGWGAPQDATFPEILQRRSGRKVLNAAISSYGTTRQIKMLERLDTSRMQSLVVQYSDNDYPENRTYLDRGRLPVSPPSIYDELVQLHAAAARYYPGKHTGLVFEAWRHVRKTESEAEQPDLARQEARAFLNALFSSRTDLERVSVVVIEINGYALNDARFTDALTEALGASGPAGPAITVLDLSSHLREDQYFVLDDHLTAEGHRTVAEALLPHLSR